MKLAIRYTFALMLSALPMSWSYAEIQLLDQVAAVVNDDVVMLSELESRVESTYARLQRSGESELPPKSMVVPRVLDRLIMERLQLNMGLRAGVRISDVELNNAITRTAEAQGLTFNQLVERAHQEGISLGELRHQIRNEMIINQVQEAKVNQRIQITEQEVKNFLNSEEGRHVTSSEARLGHIRLPLPAGASKDQVAEVTRKMQALIEQLNNGASFEEIAITHSSGQNALKGGNLGWLKVATLPADFADAVEKLQPGQLTEPLRSDAGIHLMKLYERRGGGQQLIEQSHVRHILLKPNEIRSDRETEAQLAEIRAKIIGGADFGELAKEHSEDIGSALSGGELGWSLPGQFVPQFESVMKSTDVGGVSQPFRTEFGWHLLQVTDRRTEDFSQKIKFNQAQNILHNRKFLEEREIWLQEIRDEAFVDIKLASN